jgi:hypothetical protein
VNRGIWIGDVLRALRATDDASRDRVLELLGFAVPSVTEPYSGQPADQEPSAEPDGHQPDTEPPATEVPPVPRSAAEDRGRRPSPTADIPLLTPVRSGFAPAALETSVSLPRVEERHLSPTVPYRPLFPPRSTSAILQAALSCQVDEGPIDITALVETVARCKPIPAVPRKHVPTLRFGVQVLVDMGPGMQPFRRDQEEITRQIVKTVGSEKVEVGYFAYSPLRGAGPGPRWTWRPYRPPSRRAPILLLSDLGIGGPRDDFRKSTYPEWRRFLRIAAENESGVVAFVVYPQNRWPGWLATVTHPVVWDRSSTARSARPRP